MFEATFQMFDKFQMRLGKVKKADYENISAIFMEENEPLLRQMLDYVRSGEDKDKTAKEVAVIVFDNLTEQYGKRGKLRKSLCMDLSIYMLYYLFPSIIKIEDEYSGLLADAIRDEWRVRSNNPNFNYTTYEEIRKGFKEKLFGFF